MVASQSDPYDIFSLQSQRDHLLYAQMRHEDPVHCAIDPQTGRRVWFLTAYDDCLSFLKDKRFGKEFRQRLPLHLSETWLTDDKDSIINQHMLNLDDPDHARLKTLVHLAFTPTQIMRLRPKIQTIADNLFDDIDKDVADGAEFDLTEHYIRQLPLMTIAVMLGIPIADYNQLHQWTQTMLLSDKNHVQPALTAFSNYLSQQIDLRQKSLSPSDDVLSGLMFAENDGDRLSRDELLAMVFLLITAGYETMVNFISNAILALFDNPQQLRLLQENQANPAMMRNAIEEMLRYSGPSHMTLASWAFEDITLVGKNIHQGDVVHAILIAANRDPLIFENPQNFNILRDPNKHIAFSYGLHHCLGAALARLEGDIAITTLLRRIPNL